MASNINKKECSLQNRVQSDNRKSHNLAQITDLNNLLGSIRLHENKDENVALCPSHAKPLKMYCTKCKVPICIECTEIKHAAGDGKHELINILTAFDKFKDTSEEFKQSANEFKRKTENVLKLVVKNSTELEQSKKTSLTKIDNQVQEMVQIIHIKGDEMKKEVEEHYENEKKVNDTQLTKLTKITSEVNTTISSLNQLLMSEPTTAMKSSEIVLNMMEEFNQSEEIKQKDSRQINFIRNQHPIDLLKENSIGNVVFKPLPINVSGKLRGLVKCDDDCFLVSSWTNEIYKYNLSGEHISKITLPEDMRVNRMYRMKNGNIAFSDGNNKCIQVCDVNGNVIKSIGKGALESPWGFHIDESTNVVYVADVIIERVFMFNLNSGKTLKIIGAQRNGLHGYCDVALTKTRNILMTDEGSNQVLLYDNKDKSLKVLINEGNEDGYVIGPKGVVVDVDDNIIIASKNKLQLFSCDGYFIKRIDQQEDGINHPRQLCIVSCNPHMVAVLNLGDRIIKIFNY